MIVIYGAEWCSYCNRAKALAKRYELDFVWKDVDDDQVKQELVAQLPEYKTIPQIWWHGNHIGGYNEFATEIENTRNFGQETI